MLVEYDAATVVILRLIWRGKKESKRRGRVCIRENADSQIDSNQVDFLRMNTANH